MTLKHQNIRIAELTTLKEENTGNKDTRATPWCEHYSVKHKDTKQDAEATADHLRGAEQEAQVSQLLL